MKNPKTFLEQRLIKRQPGWLDIRSDLRHFALINYAVPPERLAPHIPTDRFEIPTYDINGRQLALLSVVPFVDDDFCFYRLLPWFKFRFPQTNFRVYVIDRATGEPVVWFFGTTLGSRVVSLARALWRIPWHWATYAVDCEYDENAGTEHGRSAMLELFSQPSCRPAAGGAGGSDPSASERAAAGLKGVDERLERRTWRKAWMGFAMFAPATLGTAGFCGVTNDQCGSYAAPSAIQRLINSFCYKICRIMLNKFILIFKRIMPLCIWHCSTVKPYIY